MPPRKILVVSSQYFRIVDLLRKAFGKYGTEVHWFDYHMNRWFDRHIIHTIDMQAHNLRVQPNSKSFFQGPPLSHLQYRGRKLLEKIYEVAPGLVLMVRGQRFTEEVLRKAVGDPSSSGGTSSQRSGWKACSWKSTDTITTFYQSRVRGQGPTSGVRSR